MKKCSKCQCEKELTEFYPHPKYPNKLRSKCKACYAIDAADWRLKNRDRHNARARQWARDNKEKQRDMNKRNWEKIKDKRKAFIDKVKTDSGGCPCGEKRLSCLVFHHIDGKDTEVSKLRTVATVAKEVVKCCVICSNCHLLYHNGELELTAKPVALPYPT